jgi:hypothetical protein
LQIDGDLGDRDKHSKQNVIIIIKYFNLWNIKCYFATFKHTLENYQFDFSRHPSYVWPSSYKSSSTQTVDNIVQPHIDIGTQTTVWMRSNTILWDFRLDIIWLMFYKNYFSILMTLCPSNVIRPRIVCDLTDSFYWFVFFANNWSI